MARIIGPLRLSFACAVLLAVGLATLPATAQQKTEPARALTAADYARAERLLNYNTTPLVFRYGHPAGVVDWRAVLVSRHDADRHGVPDRRSIDRHQSCRVRSCEAGGCAVGAAGAKYSATQLPFTEFTRATGGRRDPVRSGRTTLALRC